METKMERIVLFAGGIETQEFFSVRIGEFLKQEGYDVFFFNWQQEQECLISLMWFCEKKNTVLITFNFQGIAGEPCFINKKGESFWDEREVLCINFVVDHPFYYHDYLLKIPQRYHHIHIDRFHKKYIERFYPNVKHSSFFVLAGTELDKQTSLQEKNREHEIIFTGNYTSPHTFDRYFMCKGKEYEILYREMAEDLITHPERTMEEVMEEHIREELGVLDDSILRVCMKNLIFIDLYVRFYFRGEVMKVLVDNGFSVHTFGQGWELLDCKHPENIVMAGGVNSLTCLKEIKKSKISLNVMPWFKDGAHDRIFNSMLNGAMCFSDDSIYLRQEMQNQEMVFYSLQRLEEIPFLIKEYIKNDEKRIEIAKRGYKKAKKEHTWNEIGKEIIKIIQNSDT